MDEVFGRVGGRFRISITDSTMMRILHCAMDKSHERAKSKEGFLERLNEISKFYQLAVIQLEGCLKFIQEETDHNGFESSDEEVLGDLTDIRDRLAGRLKESEIAILEKDRELKEILENEWKLRQALELKERKLDSLRKDLELERTKSEGIEELMLGNRSSVDEERDEEFSELKNSVDQQVWNIKQKLDPDYRLIDRRNNQNIDDIKIEQMSSDIDILKETMDLAFGKMHCAMILSELEPVERQWGWMIEKDVMAILFKGFMEDIHGNLEAEVGRREKDFSIRLSNYLSDLERELYCLRTELEPDQLVSTSQQSPESKNSLRAKGRSSSEEVPDNSTRMLEDDGDSHYVAKMIKNHESIIRRKSEEMNSLKREIIRERRRSSSREEKEPTSPTRKIQNVFTVLDNLITWNAKLGGRLNHCGDDGSMEIHSKKLSSDLSKTEEKSQFDTLEDVWQKVNQNSVCRAADTEDLKSQISKLKMEKEEVNVQNMITEMIYTTLLEGFMHDSRSELNCYSLKQAKSERLYEDSLKEMVKECNEQLEIHTIEFQNREELSYVVLGKAVNDFSSAPNYALTESQHLRAKSNSLEDDVLEEKLKEEISRICFGEMSNERNEANEISETERLAKQEVYQIAFEENIRVIRNNANQMLEAYLETLIREETFQLIILEAVKEVNTTCGEAEFQDHSGVLRKEKLFSAPTLYGIQGVSGGQILTKKQESLQKDDNKEKFKLNSSSETKECSAKHIAKDARVLLNEMKCSSTSACREIGKASEQIDMSKTILSLLRSSLNIRAEGIERSDQINPYKSLFRNQTYCFQAEELMNGFVYDKFLQAFLNFKSKVEERIDFNTLRLKKIMHHLNPIAELIASLKTKEWLYRKAFTRRCENLRKAEIEVDLLGDQVELLLDLLEKIYKTLHHHSPALGQYFDVSDILMMIEKELGGVHASSKDAIASWMKLKMSPHVRTVETEEKAQDILSAKSKLVFGFLNSLEDVVSEELADVPKLHDDIEFYQTTNVDIARLFGMDPEITCPALFLLQREPGMNHTLFRFVGEFTGSAISEFVSVYKLPSVITFTVEEAPLVFNNPMKQLWLFTPKLSRGATCTFKEAAMAFKEKLLFVHVETGCGDVGRLLSYQFGVTEDASKVVAYTPTGNSKKHLYTGELTLSGITSFANQFLEDKLMDQQDLKSDTLLKLPTHFHTANPIVGSYVN